MTIFAFESTDDKIDINAVADEMERKGWKMERQSATIHCTILPHHTMEKSTQLVGDLKEAVDTVRVSAHRSTYTVHTYVCTETCTQPIHGIRYICTHYRLVTTHHTHTDIHLQTYSEFLFKGIVD